MTNSPDKRDNDPRRYILSGNDLKSQSSVLGRRILGVIGATGLFVLFFFMVGGIEQVLLLLLIPVPAGFFYAAVIAPVDEYSRVGEAAIVCGIVGGLSALLVAVTFSIGVSGGYDRDLLFFGLVWGLLFGGAISALGGAGGALLYSVMARSAGEPR